MPICEIFDWLFPAKCLICGNEVLPNSILCSNCFSKITFVDYPFCDICGKILENSYSSTYENFPCQTCQTHPRYFDKARTLFVYDGFSKNIVMKIKKQADNFVANSCVQMLFSKYKSIFAQSDFIVPVPSHWSRILKRGYNPATIIAVEFSKISGLPIRKILKRSRKTDYQKGKNISERLENVKDAFCCTTDLSNKNIILIDDVMTTGATLNECAKVLKNCNCLKIFCFTIGSTAGYKPT